MSKKASLFIAVLVAVIGVIFVAMFGKLPENLIPKIYMEKLYFVTSGDSPIEVDSKGNKIMYFKISKNSLSIDLYSYIKYEPNDTTNIDVNFFINDNEIATINRSTGFLTFEENKIDKFNTIKVTVESKDGSNLKDSVTIKNSKYQDSGKEDYDNFEWL